MFRNTKVRGKCTLKGCEIKHYARGMCRSHYERNRLNGDPGAPEVAPPTRIRTRGTCTVEQCEKQHYAHGLCQPHYNAKRMTEHPAARADQCSLKGCTLRHLARGLCYIHYAAFQMEKKKTEALAAVGE